MISGISCCVESVSCFVRLEAVASHCWTSGRGIPCGDATLNMGGEPFLELDGHSTGQFAMEVGFAALDCIVGGAICAFPLRNTVCCCDFLVASLESELSRPVLLVDFRPDLGLQDRLVSDWYRLAEFMDCKPAKPANARARLSSLHRVCCQRSRSKF